MGKPVARWNKAGKWISGIVVLCFFLPFFGISCDNVDVVHFSGVDMVGGCAPGGMLVDMAEEGKSTGGRHGGGDMKMDAKIDKVDREPLAIVALAAALIVFGAAWQKSKGGRALALAFALVSLGAIGGLFVSEKGKLDDMISEQNKGKKDLGKEMMKDTKIEAGARFGLWVTAFGLLTLAGLAGAALKQGEDPADPAPLPPAFAPPPTA